MIVSDPTDRRELKCEHLSCDLAIAGGGVAAVCTAITAARQGAKVTLIQDRPVLGGNASSEVRLWVLGATAHMYNNNRWSREGGIMDEILVENMYRNAEGNPLIFDILLLEKVTNEPNITLLLNTAVYDVEKESPNRIRSITAFCSQNSTTYKVAAPYFCDGSGDGIVGFMAGAAFRMGAETKDEFGELFAPDESFGSLLGHSIYFYSKDTGKPVDFIAPSFAMKDIEKIIPRYKDFKTEESGCKLWWIEYGGRLDTVHDSEKIKWELWQIVYGVWDYIKNSGKFPDARNLTLEWVGTIPGKRESRRFEGDHILTQKDIVNLTQFEDAVSFGGWSIDLHPADGVYSEKPGSIHMHPQGIYQIPYRCLYSRNIDNLFLTGRITSSSHVAFGSTRVIATAAHSGQAVGIAAKMCLEKQCQPADIYHEKHYPELQVRLERTGQHIPRIKVNDSADLAQTATISASSEYIVSNLPDCGETVKLESSWAQMIPVNPGALPSMNVIIDAFAETTLTVELRVSAYTSTHTPNIVLESKEIQLTTGNNQSVEVTFDANIDETRHVYLVFMKNESVAIHTSDLRLSGWLTTKDQGYEQSKEDEEKLGGNAMPFWCPQRRPGGKNFAVKFSQPIACFSCEHISNGVKRPSAGTNAWIPAQDDPQPTLQLEWDESQTIKQLTVFLDTDFDHAMESVLMGHPENIMPFCQQAFEILDGDEQVIYSITDNHESRIEIHFDQPIRTSSLKLRLPKPSGNDLKSIMGISVFKNQV
ncbi:FAD-dependent oxidoreductase [Rubellicoccus peritrichatus]|uniref:FAD-dependent oxidoreductase n=1 Tax=Rubellicoccus peritrichatus TaxID=3080537 RepID=A0AAQ3LDV4_9BACT|nr:FAD-dependent oxidoreductase [Puniceicoccus sp. CR14]WOO43572.1 FAD-dependent oxidoreductase [Puniceicoccus sp. CR14]